MAIWKDAFLATETALTLQDGDPTRSYVYGLADGNFLVIGTDGTDTYDSGAGPTITSRVFSMPEAIRIGEPFQIEVPTDDDNARSLTTSGRFQMEVSFFQTTVNRFEF